MPAFSSKNLGRLLRNGASYFLSAAISLLLIAVARPQELKDQPTPFSVWLDFRALSGPNSPKVALPIWFDSLTTQSVPATGATAAATIFRLRFRQIAALNTELLLRLFFDDVKDAGLTVSGWSETGGNLFQRGPLGNGLDLPSSESLVLPMTGVDYVDISVAGDGTPVRGAFLASLKRATVKQPIDYPPESAITDAFGNLPPLDPNADDSNLLGRVQATIDPGTMKLTSGAAEAGSWKFQLQSPPLIAVVTFEVLDMDATAPPDIIVNNQPLGAVTIHMPDLADPAYVGVVRPLDKNMHFRYTGWLRAQKVIPASALQAGLNSVIIQLNKESGSIAIRSVELQLKYNAPGLDITISTSAQ